MKTLFLFFMALMFSLNVLGQKCRYTIDSKDAFSGEKINTIVHNNSGWTWTSSKRGNKYLIDMTFLHAGEVQKSFTTADSILIKFTDGSVLRLSPVADALPARGAVSSTTSSSSPSSVTTRALTSVNSVTSYSPTFEVDREVYVKLTQSMITVIRFDFTGKPIDLDFTTRPLNKSAPKLMEDARCILSLN